MPFFSAVRIVVLIKSIFITHYSLCNRFTDISNPMFSFIFSSQRGRGIMPSNSQLVLQLLQKRVAQWEQRPSPLQTRGGVVGGGP